MDNPGVHRVELPSASARVVGVVHVTRPEPMAAALLPVLCLTAAIVGMFPAQTHTPAWHKSPAARGLGAWVQKRQPPRNTE